jgi:hypothetical protein
MIKKLPGWKRGMIVGINIRELDVKREGSVGFFCRVVGRGGFGIPTNKFMGCCFWWLPRINPWVA